MMLSEPLSLIILLLFLLILSLVLLTWFAITMGARPEVAAIKTEKRAVPKPQKRVPKKVIEKVAPEKVMPEKVMSERARPQLKAEPVPEFRMNRRTANEAKLRLSNDQVRGLHAKATRVTPSSNEVALEPASPKPTTDDDAFERFIRSKNDELEF
jgi:hypothetical protein